MAELSQSFVQAGHSGSNFFTDLRARYNAWRIYRRTLAELSMLSDRELYDLGVHRSQIQSIAMEASHRK
ncbi:DUF1127 domain-containing protein [Palleronia caenipelagi]|uniref:DUF1127 domain-containing protein n=1 Tax=Palleronia caenipelagi TaxID=2489174 RepID=A0A547PT74_9RHOB|nr:DUF1127 domain-containing protein [Palleronia caenipelagi]TRD17347.1 DUF1127 domain-containing protein [Palleronia caenipelagi]